jgi:hypothetical protein
MRRLSRRWIITKEITAISGIAAAADHPRPSKAAMAKLGATKKRTRVSNLQSESVHPLRKTVKF